MSATLSEKSVKELFETVLQHAKCIEVRIECAKGLTSQKQKHALNAAMLKVQGAINVICDLLPNSDSVLKVKKNLDHPGLVYVMLLTESLLQVKNQDDMEELVEVIDKYLINKYGKPEQVQGNREDKVC